MKTNYPSGDRRGRPRHVCPRIVVVTPMDQVQKNPGQIVLRIDPKEAFGDGSHPSTRLALQLLDELLGGQYGPHQQFKGGRLMQDAAAECLPWPQQPLVVSRSLPWTLILAP
ncbi:MAG: 50S ribosomal protein L11 methyltransferase [Desulfobacterales bacterium]|nr:50S ribosomal protein L11 methyltransferase [Desulfobacterales bacterium]